MAGRGVVCIKKAQDSACLAAITLWRLALACSVVWLVVALLGVSVARQGMRAPTLKHSGFKKIVYKIKLKHNPLFHGVTFVVAHFNLLPFWKFD